MANIKVKNVKLTNFRNIEHAEYNLSDCCCFVGKNYIGKTNTILAIYWLLTGKLLDGSSDDMSLKPNQDTKQKVSVEVVFDKDGLEKKIFKSYEEKWTKKRGSDEVVLSGHETIYAIDDIVQKTNSAALREISEFLELTPEKYFNLSKIDIYQLLMNPFYAAEQLEWKLLRDLIIHIIGDISNEEVMLKDSRISSGKELLEKYNYDLSKSLQYVNQEISQCNKSIMEKDVAISELSKSEDVPIADVQSANLRIAKIDEAISDLKNGYSTKDPRLESLEIKIKELELNIRNQTLKEKEAFNDKNSILNAQIKEFRNEYEKFLGFYKNAVNEEQKILFEIGRKENLIQNKEELIKTYLFKQKELRVSFDNEANKTFTYNKIFCPNCNYQLNKEDENYEKKVFIDSQNRILDSIDEEGKRLKLQIESCSKEIESIKAELLTLQKSLEASREKVKTYQQSAKQKENDYFEFSNQKIVFEESDILKSLKEQLANSQITLSKLKNSSIQSSNGMNEKIKELEDSKKPYEDILAKRYAYLANMKTKDIRILELKEITNKKMKYETQKEAIEIFNRTKLEMFDNKLSRAFPDIKFILFEDNITESSWNQVCYPLIDGKKVPFISGSTSEKILTGVKIIEALKNALSINGLPIVIDECAQLDKESLSKIKTLTSSQIIATKVDDNYSQVHLEIL